MLHPAVAKLGRIIKTSDAVICAPGGICMGGFMSWDHVFQLLLARKYKKPLFYWGRSIGPFTDEDARHSRFKDCAEETLHYAAAVFLRDSQSVNIAKGMGVRAVSMVDSAFLEVPGAAVPAGITTAVGSSPYMVFVPNSLTWHYRFKDGSQEKIDLFYEQIFDLIKSAHPNWKMVMLPQTYQSKVNDYAYFKRLAATYESRKGKDCGILVIDENQSSDIQQKIIAGSELVIGARYHSVVFAINNARPFVSLSYEHKMSGLLETLGLTGHMVPIQDIFDAGNEEKFAEAIAGVGQKIAMARSVPEGTAKAKGIVSAAFEELCAGLETVRRLQAYG